jgi:hypothetical protein
VRNFASDAVDIITKSSDKAIDHMKRNGTPYKLENRAQTSRYFENNLPGFKPKHLNLIYGDVENGSKALQTVR